MEKAGKIKWSEEALEDLDDIWCFIAEDNPERASSFVNEILDFVQSLEYAPKKGRMIPEFGRESAREIFYQNYGISYELDEITGKIIIHEVVNCFKWYTRTKKREQ